MTIKEQIQENYPELAGKWLDNERGDFITDEGFIEVISRWDKYLERYKDILLRNIVQVWKLTQNMGYSVLQRDWEAFTWAKDDTRYTIELAEETLMDKIHCVLGRLYNASRYGKKGSRTKQFGMTGLLIVASMNVRIEQSNTRDMDDVVLQFGIDMQLYGGDHEEFKITEA